MNDLILITQSLNQTQTVLPATARETQFQESTASTEHLKSVPEGRGNNFVPPGQLRALRNRIGPIISTRKGNSVSSAPSDSSAVSPIAISPNSSPSLTMKRGIDDRKDCHPIKKKQMKGSLEENDE